MLTAPVNKIIPMSMVDGPGNRCAVFFQGCNFNCTFCHNPETINLCNHCGRCVDTCNYGALKIEADRVVYTRQNCTDCDACISICPINASPKIQNFSPVLLAKTVKKFMPFIQGITTSGGECTLYADFLTQFFKLTREFGLTNFVDTNGSILMDSPKYQRFLDVTDAFMLDVKAYDGEEHIKLTGQSNQVVLQNLEFLVKKEKLFEVRTVLIDGYDNLKTVNKVIEVLSPYLAAQPIRYKLIKYRHYGVRDAYKNQQTISDSQIARLERALKCGGFREVVVV